MAGLRLAAVDSAFVDQQFRTTAAYKSQGVVAIANEAAYAARMALVRILVDGYSLLHNWPELLRGRAPHTAAAREELVHRLTRYQDAAGTPITIFFDGSRPRAGMGMPDATPGTVEVLYSSSGQTADQMIERAAHRFRPYGEVLAVTDDHAERETVLSLGGFAASCRNFIEQVEQTLSELQDDLKTRNRQEQHAFKRRQK